MTFIEELGLMLRHHQLDSEANLVARERAILTDRIAAVQTMSAGLAHEVRNPLNAARLQLELLERRLQRDTDDPRFLEPTRLVGHELGRLTELLDDLLAFVQTGALRRQEIDVITLARQVLEGEQPLAAARAIHLELAPDADAIVADVDPGKLHQIIRNLVRNAIEAAPVNGRVEVHALRDATGLHLRITDDGSGMSDPVRARVFEPFYSTKDGGTGMGMAIVHNFVAMHGGTIDIATSPRGTTIHVALP